MLVRKVERSEILAMSVLKGTWVVVEDSYECLLEIQQERRIGEETVDSQICTMRVFD